MAQDILKRLGEKCGNEILEFSNQYPYGVELTEEDVVKMMNEITPECFEKYMDTYLECIEDCPEFFPNSP